MSILRALIVDDSKTAQWRLQKLLQPYPLTVDSARSAEEALGYLSYRTPVVIFMDHHMEGMDGFDALKILKANPSTATIPVIMYTSQSGALYTGQAHALGALDILSKEVIKPSNLEEVLAKLHIYPGEAPARDDGDDAGRTQPPGAVAGGAEREPPPINASELRAQIARLFELHIADVRTQIAEHTKFIVRRLSGEIEQAAHQEPRLDDVPLSVINGEAESARSRGGLLSTSLLLLIFIALGAIAFQLYRAELQARALDQNYRDLADLAGQQTLQMEDLISSAQARPSARRQPVDSKALVETIAWAMDMDLRVDYPQPPLGEAQLLTLQNLLFKLDAAGFKGFIELNIHFGNFCLRQAEGGDWQLAAPATPLGECVFTQSQKIDLNVENYVSVPYLQFEHSAAPVQNGNIELLLNLIAFAAPRVNYPSANNTTAGEWNAVAASNNRISVSLELAD